MQQLVVSPHPAVSPLASRKSRTTATKAGFDSGFRPDRAGNGAPSLVSQQPVRQVVRRQFEGATAEELHGYAFVTALVAFVVYAWANGERKDEHRLHLAYAIYGTFVVFGTR